MELSDTALKDQLSIRSGRERDAGLNLYSVVRNEMFFLPAFLAHYRKLGIEQFYFLDDHSSDGTGAYLADQDDCILLTSPHSFGDALTVRWSNGIATRGRAGTMLKRAIPEKYLSQKWALYADADEFLILPPAFTSLGSVVNRLEDEAARSVVSSLIDFYPRSLQEQRSGWHPESFEKLIDHTPYFDAVRFLQTRPGLYPLQRAPTASARLFTMFGIRETPAALRMLPEGIISRLPFGVPRSPWLKTPLIKWDGQTWMEGSHRANVPPPEYPVLAMAHFKFTADFTRRVMEAIARKSHARGSEKYRHYQSLINRMRERNFGFLGPHSKRYRRPRDLMLAGLMS